MNCEKCKYWKKHNYNNLGDCINEKWNIHPNYYEESDRITEKDMIQVTYQPSMGPMFGCIHYEKK